MKRPTFPDKRDKIVLYPIIALALMGVFIFATAATAEVAAGSSTIPLNMIYYGWHDATVDNNIVNAHPEFLVDNSPAGPWKGNASISKFSSAGIKYFEYIDGGYEGTAAQAIPNDLQSNLNYINAAAAAGAYGVFLDEVSSNPSAESLAYLKQIADRAHSLGLKVVFNVGVDSWSDSLMKYCDFINSSEVWNNASLTESQSKWANKTWLLSQNVTSASTATNLTNGAIGKGIRAHYACPSYGALPSWLGTYSGNIRSSEPSPKSKPISPPEQIRVNFVSNPIGSEIWLDYSYMGVTPMTLTVSAGSHHIGFNKYGYHNNSPIEADFLVGISAMIVNGDLMGGQISFPGAASSNPDPSPATVLIAPGVASAATCNMTANSTTLHGNLSGSVDDYIDLAKATSSDLKRARILMEAVRRNSCLTSKELKKLAGALRQPSFRRYSLAQSGFFSYYFAKKWILNRGYGASPEIMDTILSGYGSKRNWNQYLEEAAKKAVSVNDYIALAKASTGRYQDRILLEAVRQKKFTSGDLKALADAAENPATRNRILAGGKNVVHFPKPGKQSGHSDFSKEVKTNQSESW